jgi:hypothetical protein
MAFKRFFTLFRHGKAVLAQIFMQTGQRCWFPACRNGMASSEIAISGEYIEWVVRRRDT